MTLKERIERKEAELADARGWIEDLRGLNPSQQDIFFATNQVMLLQDDLRRLKQEHDK